MEDKEEGKPVAPKVGVAQTSVVMAAIESVVSSNLDDTVHPVMFIKPWGRQELYAAPMCNAIEAPSIVDVLEKVNIEEYVMLAVGKMISLKSGGTGEETQKAIKEIIKAKTKIIQKYMTETGPEDFDPKTLIEMLQHDKTEDDYDLEVVDGALIVEMFGDKEFSAEVKIREKGGYRYLDEPTYSVFDEEEFYLAGRDPETGAVETKARSLPYGRESDGVCSDDDIQELREALATIGFFMNSKDEQPFFQWGKEIHENKISEDQGIGTVN